MLSAFLFSFLMLLSYHRTGQMYILSFLLLSWLFPTTALSGFLTLNQLESVVDKENCWCVSSPFGEERRERSYHDSSFPGEMCREWHRQHYPLCDAKRKERYSHCFLLPGEKKRGLEYHSRSVSTQDGYASEICSLYMKLFLRSDERASEKLLLPVRNRQIHQMFPLPGLNSTSNITSKRRAKMPNRIMPSIFKIKRKICIIDTSGFLLWIPCASAGYNAGYQHSG